MLRLLLSCVALLLALSIALLSGLFLYHASYSYEYADLLFDNFTLEGNRLTFKVSSQTDGEYIYRLLISTVVNGELSVTIRGGKQAALAQTPGENFATFTIEMPEGTEKVVLGKSTLYTV